MKSSQAILDLICDHVRNQGEPCRMLDTYIFPSMCSRLHNNGRSCFIGCLMKGPVRRLEGMHIISWTGPDMRKFLDVDPKLKRFLFKLQRAHDEWDGSDFIWMRLKEIASEYKLEYKGEETCV